MTFRGAVLAALGSAPLPAAAHAAIAEGAVAAAAFSALILLIWLLMSAHSRDMTLARLATMGLRPGPGPVAGGAGDAADGPGRGRGRRGQRVRAGAR